MSKIFTTLTSEPVAFITQITASETVVHRSTLASSESGVTMVHLHGPPVTVVHVCQWDRARAIGAQPCSSEND